jgi:crotonobetainyl-CoA:carnitine CoA-transferase CaiB-like acyl-CoA transferase
MLNNLRVLDLTDQKGFFCGKILAEFGMDVIKIEPPGGDPARNIGPFYHDIQDPNKSLYWLAYNESKRGITLDIRRPEGREIFKALVYRADVVIESSHPGYLENMGLAYEQLAAINPKLIMASITAFGQTGPYRDFKGCDLISMALGGIMSQTGEKDGPPCRLDPDHTYCLTGTNAALAIFIAYYHRELSGEGQYIDVSMLECVIRENYREVPVSWEFGHYNASRNGGLMNRGRFYSRTIWPCRDGHVTWTMFGGKVGANDNERLAEWMAEEGLLDGLDDIDWRNLDFETLTQKEVDRIESRVLKLTLNHDKKDLEREAVRRGVRLSAVNDVKELFESDQLGFRNFWQYVEHPALAERIAYPGQLFLSNETEVGVRHKAPDIGEHNKAIYEDEMGFKKDKMLDLAQKGII